jgi:RNA polymerase sigma-70 factor (ECF subfamily)
VREDRGRVSAGTPNGGTPGGGAPSDEALLAAYVAGDGAAFRALFSRYAPVLLRVLRRYTGSDADASDLVQHTFLQVHRARHDFREGARFRPWVFTIALNLAREHHRRRSRRQESPLDAGDVPEPVADLAPAPSDGEYARRRVQQALASLPDAQREVIVLHWLEERPMAEIAEVVGASVTAVKVRAHRGYERLRGLLADLRGAGGGDLAEEEMLGGNPGAAPIVRRRTDS